MAKRQPTGRPPHHIRALSAISSQPLTAARAARLIASVTLVVTLVSGVVMHWADERNFPTVGRGLWWAVQTVTTVGYGDVVPRTTVGQLVAALVMIVGIAFLAVTTAAIASTFIESARRQLEGSAVRGLDDKLAQIGTQLAVIEAKLTEGSGHERDAS